MKTNVFIKYLMMFWVFLLPIQSLIVTSIVLIFVDFITGIIASYKLNIRITSKAMQRTVYKIIAFVSMIILGYVLEKYMLDFPVTKTFGGLIGLIEGKSILENLYKITKVDLLKIMIDHFHLKYESSISPVHREKDDQ